MTALSTGLEGLDLICGGLRLIARGPTPDDRSATVLVRGGPGVGKSVLGAKMALAVADKLGGAALFGCIEILPPELEQQWVGLNLSTRPLVYKPWGGAGPQTPFASVLDPDPTSFEQAVENLIDLAKGHGCDPKVLVIDSVSDGYGIGPSTQRVLADGICKIAAQRGLVLIVLEECQVGQPSAWAFAVDVVIELERGDGHPSVLRVPKNRFGLKSTRENELWIGDGVEVIPMPEHLPSPPPLRTPPVYPAFMFAKGAERPVIVSVVGPDTSASLGIASLLRFAPDVKRVDVRHALLRAHHSSVCCVEIWREMLDAGGLAILTNVDVLASPEGGHIRAPLSILLHRWRDSGRSAVLVETCPPLWRAMTRGVLRTDTPYPWSAAWADIVVEYYRADLFRVVDGLADGAAERFIQIPERA